MPFAKVDSMRRSKKKATIGRLIFVFSLYRLNSKPRYARQRVAPYFVGAGGAAGAAATVSDAAVAGVAAGRAGRSNTRVVNRPNTSPQKAAPIPNIGTSATATRKHTRPPS